MLLQSNVDNIFEPCKNMISTQRHHEISENFGLETLIKVIKGACTTREIRLWSELIGGHARTAHSYYIDSRMYYNKCKHYV